jgi:phospholipid/cholesterol/gamma-HCH transport system substrate-binding protein
MKRVNEVLVGGTLIGALALVVAGSLWLSQMQWGGGEQTGKARFRTIGGLQTGNPVVVRGVRIGRVTDISLASNNWVIVTMAYRLRQGATIPPHTAAIISSTTLFGDWGVGIMAESDLPEDPEVRRQIEEAKTPPAAPAARGRPGDARPPDIWPGATLPDIGQLTQQAGRIAGDIASIAGRVENAFDSTSARRLQGAFLDLSTLSRRMSQIVTRQQQQLTAIGENIDTGTAALARGAQSLERTLRRADSATSGQQLQRILGHADTVTTELREIAANLRIVSGAAAAQQASIGRIIVNTDSMFARVQAGEGTLGKLSRDSALYNESVATVQALRRMLEDMKSNPRRYFSFSVF